MPDFDFIYVQEMQFKCRFGGRFTAYIAQLGTDDFELELYWHLDTGTLQKLRVPTRHVSAKQAFRAAVEEVGRYEKIQSDPIEEVVNPCNDPFIRSEEQKDVLNKANLYPSVLINPRARQ
jgi:hypothetical protein